MVSIKMDLIIFSNCRKCMSRDLVRMFSRNILLKYIIKNEIMLEVMIHALLLVKILTKK